MKYLKTFEQFDTPELKGTFTPKDIRGMTFAQSPWEGPYRKFQYGSIGGDEPSYNLNHWINQVSYKNADYGIGDVLYEILKKYVPDFKDFEMKDHSDFGDGKIGIWLKKEVKLQGSRFNAESEIWVYYHSKSNKWLDYKKGKIYVLFVCGLRPTEKSFDLMGGSKKQNTEEDNEVRKAFTDMIKPSCTGCSGEEEIELDDKGFDNFMYKLGDILSGHPDKEDEELYKRLQVYYKNLTMDSFVKSLSKVKNNLDYFKKYVKNKYNLDF